MSKKALIVGVTGQDGAYLARLLLEKGYEVWGTSRDIQASSFNNLKKLGIYDEVNKVSTAINEFRSVLQTISAAEPEEIYNLAGQSSVAFSFDHPVETLDSISSATLNFLEAIRYLGNSIRLYNAGSSECFGDTQGVPANESTPFNPRSPYAVAKSAAHWEVANYREAYGLYACTGILFNHESPLRPARFVTRKIVSTACNIHRGSAEKLHLGKTDIKRDWGWAPEYVDAMWRMMQQAEPQDYVIATGKTISLREFCALVFKELGLDVNDHLVEEESLHRPLEIIDSRGDPSLAKKQLGWEATNKIESVVEKLVQAELDLTGQA